MFDFDNVQVQLIYIFCFVNEYIRLLQGNYVSSVELFGLYQEVLPSHVCMHKNYLFKELELMMRGMNIPVNNTRKNKEGRGYLAITLQNQKHVEADAASVLEGVYGESKDTA